ncbi:MAG: tRNA epoxyqueuosine(34) reductase QueG [Gammaproteobacteria bacterium]|nr:tRNA epoxyqueuosine(34) reductase QueG [Gammaproteobacteria bacterium]
MANQDNNFRSAPERHALAKRIKAWGRELGFQQIGITRKALADDERYLGDWLARGRHGEMAYMARHGTKRSRPEQLIPGTLSVVSARMDYLPPEKRDPAELLEQSDIGYISRYALGRDYHKVLRKRLQKLADRITDEIGPFGYRAFVDSAPVLEKAHARNAGLGWIGKHTNLINNKAGSWFFLGELFVDLELPEDEAADDHCGTCRACIDVCPTGAIVAPYELDARRCISYLTIELHGPIPEEFRKAIGNRVYGCDDCQLFCPWNKFAQLAQEPDFAPRNDLDATKLTELFAWSEEEFLAKTQGSAIRRIGYENWLRNLAVALGNSETTEAVIMALKSRRNHASALVREHVEWGLTQHEAI